MKTSELVGPALDWAVAKCESGSEFEFDPMPYWPDENGLPSYFTPSTDWWDGGLIIERERITVEYTADPDTWCACIMADQEVYGPTALIAAMRCYVASKLGDEVEVPEGLSA